MRGSFRRAFDTVIAWGMMFLLSADVPKPVIRNVARRSPVGEQFGEGDNHYYFVAKPESDR